MHHLHCLQLAAAHLLPPLPWDNVIMLYQLGKMPDEASPEPSPAAIVRKSA